LCNNLANSYDKRRTDCLFFIWLGWRAGIPLKTHQTIGVSFFLIAAAAGLILFITNITGIARDR